MMHSFGSFEMSRALLATIMFSVAFATEAKAYGKEAIIGSTDFATFSSDSYLMRRAASLDSGVTDSTRNYTAAFSVNLPLTDIPDGAKVKIKLKSLGIMAECHPAAEKDSDQYKRKFYCTPIANTTSASTTIIFKVTVPLTAEQFAALQAFFISAIAQTVGSSPSQVEVLSIIQNSNSSGKGRRAVQDGLGVITAIFPSSEIEATTYRLQLTLPNIKKTFAANGLAWSPQYFGLVDGKASNDSNMGTDGNNSLWDGNFSDVDSLSGNAFVFDVYLSISYIEFDGQRAIFVELVARTADISEQMVKIISVQTISSSNSSRRSSPVLKVQTEIQTNDPAMAATVGARLNRVALKKTFDVNGLNWLANEETAFNGSAANINQDSVPEKAASSAIQPREIGYAVASIVAMVVACFVLRKVILMVYSRKIHPEKIEFGTEDQFPREKCSSELPASVETQWTDGIEDILHQEEASTDGSGMLNKKGSAMKNPRVEGEHAADDEAHAALGQPGQLYCWTPSGYQPVDVQFDSVPSADERRRNLLLAGAERILAAAVAAANDSSDSDILRHSPAIAKSPNLGVAAYTPTADSATDRLAGRSAAAEVAQDVALLLDQVADQRKIKKGIDTQSELTATLVETIQHLLDEAHNERIVNNGGKPSRPIGFVKSEKQLEEEDMGDGLPGFVVS